MSDNELKAFEQKNPLMYAVMRYNLNSCDYWKDKIRDLYFSIPEDSRRYCMGDMDGKDFEVRGILGLPYLPFIKNEM